MFLRNTTARGASRSNTARGASQSNTARGASQSNTARGASQSNINKKCYICIKILKIVILFFK